MSRVLSDEDIEAIAKKLTDFSGLSAAEHREHHEAFSVWIDRQNKNAAFWEKMKEQVGGWAILGVLSAIGYGAWQSFLFFVSKGGH